MNYSDPCTKSKTEQVMCEDCGYRFDVEGYTEYGCFQPDDESQVCPQCMSANWDFE